MRTHVFYRTKLNLGLNHALNYVEDEVPSGDWVVGKTLAVFRGEDGRAHALDAYCCHNGANLAAGGLVKGSCLECPFHGWQFRGDDGKCTHIPYCERNNSKLMHMHRSSLSL